MSDFALISQAIPQVFTLYNMALIFGGLILGMVIGCVPGLSVTLGIILMLPLTYTFDDPASYIFFIPLLPGALHFRHHPEHPGHQLRHRHHVRWLPAGQKG